MTRQEFIEALRIALQGKISQKSINEHLRYYDNYIMEEARKGRSEQQVIEELGSPLLIAKTLIDTTDTVGENQHEQSYTKNERQEGQAGMQFKWNSWYGMLALIIIAILIIGIVARLVAFLLPIVILVILILLIISFVLGNRRQ